METPLHRKKPNLVFYLFLGLLVLGLIYFFPTIRKDIRLMEKVQPTWLLLAILAQLATYLGSALIFSRLLKLLQTPSGISIRELFQASIVVLFANQTIPSAGISGNSFFLRFLVRRNVAAQQAIWLIAIDLLTFYFTMEAIIIAAIIAVMALPKFPGYFHAVLVTGFLVFGLFTLFIWFIARKKTMEKIISWIMHLKLMKKFAADLQEIFESSSVRTFDNPFPFFYQHKTGVLILMGIQLGIFLADGLTIFALYHGLSTGLPFTSILIGLLLTKIVSLLPISPGALVVYESSMTFFFHALGAPLGISILVTLFYRILSFWLPIPAGFLLSRKLERA